MIPVRYNVRSLLERRATSVMTTLGVAMVAMIFVILFGFVGGLKSTLLRAGNNTTGSFLSVEHCRKTPAASLMSNPKLCAYYRKSR